MSELVSTVLLKETSNGYVLRGKNTKGKNSEILLTSDDVVILAQSTQTYQAQILAERKRLGQSASFVVTADVSRIGLGHDPLGRNVILTIVADSGELSYALRLPLARNLAQMVAARVDGMEAQTLTRQ
jgi:hypothetical protein